MPETFVASLMGPRLKKKIKFLIKKNYFTNSTVPEDQLERLDVPSGHEVAADTRRSGDAVG